MSWDGIWRLTDPPMQGAQVSQIQDKARRAFGSYAIPLGVVVNGIYDAPTAAFIKEYQQRKEASGYRPRLPANPTAVRGDCDFETKVALGLVARPAPPPGPIPPYVGYAVPGTWGVWNIGPHVMAVNRSPRVQVQGIGYNTSAFLNPDPQHSYVEALAEGVAELLRWALPERRKKFFSGYSMGADVVVHALHQWPADRRDEIVQVFTFGSPGRPPGPTRLGTNWGGAGISGVYTPDWAQARELSYDIQGDMYPEARGFLPAFYQLATRMEASPEFAMYLFGWLTGIPVGGFGSVFSNTQAPPSQTGSGLLGLSGQGVPGFGALSGILGMVTPGALGTTSGPISLPQIIFNIPLIIDAIVQAMQFVFTNAHGRYWVDPIFEGQTAENHASMMCSRLSS